VAEYIRPLVDISHKLGDLVGKQADLLNQAIAAHRALLVTALQSKKPADADLLKLLQPTSDLVTQIIAVKDKAPRNHAQLNHLTAVAEGVNAFNWVAVSPTPAPFVKDAGQSAAEFWTNKILKDFKGKDQTHVDWVHAWIGFLTNLQPYIKKNHTTGLTWSGTGAASLALAAPAGKPAPKAPPAGGPPPPPPGAPPPPGPASATAAPAHAARADPSALLSELNRGLDVTKGLKKVEAKDKTKNRPAEERSSVVKAEDLEKKTGKVTKAGGSKDLPNKPPKFALDGNKWCVENTVGPKEIAITETEPKQTVYIYHCSNIFVKISGKVNTIIIDACDKVGVLFDNAIASVEVVNSHAVQVQVTGKVPSFAVDKTSGFQLYLSPTCLDAEIITSKSDSMNIVLPPAKEGDDLTEVPIPEQYKTVIKNNKLVTDIVRHE